jgi:hypothetical protein
MRPFGPFVTFGPIYCRGTFCGSNEEYRLVKALRKAGSQPNKAAYGLLALLSLLALYIAGDFCGSNKGYLRTDNVNKTQIER